MTKKKKNLKKMYESKGFTVEKDAGHGAYHWMKWKKK